MAITAMGCRIARNGRVNAVRRTDAALYERMVNHVYGNSGRPGSLIEEAVKVLMSGGILSPPKIPFDRVHPVSWSQTMVLDGTTPETATQ